MNIRRSGRNDVQKLHSSDLGALPIGSPGPSSLYFWSGKSYFGHSHLASLIGSDKFLRLGSLENV